MMTTIRAMALALLCLLPSLSAEAASPFQEALRAMAAGDLGRARDALSRLIRGRDPVALEARLLVGRAQFLAGRTDEAARSFSEVIQADPEGRLGIKARFGLAECRARAKDFDDAERLYAEALRRLDSPERREELARRFIELADENLRPAERKEPDPARAERFLLRAREILFEGPLAEEVDLRIARCQMKQKKYAEAATHLESLLRRTPPPARADEIRYRLARALVRSGEPARARSFLREVLASRPPSAFRASAQFLMSRTYGYPKPKNAEDLVLGREAMRRFIDQNPNDRRAERARRELFGACVSLGRFVEAENEIRRALSQGGSEDFLATARFQLGVSLAGQGRLAEAEAAYQEYLQQHPAHTHWMQAQAAIEALAWEMGEQAVAKKDWTAAAQKFEQFAERFAGSVRAPQALRRAANASVELRQFDRALSLLSLLSAKFSNSPEAVPAQIEAARLWEEEKGDAIRAREIYRKLESAQKNPEASARLLALDQPSLWIEGPPVFMGGARPRLTWRTRNIEAVSIRSFRLRAEDFFREHLSFDNLRDVDIALCTPDAAWTVPVKNFVRHVRLRQEVELPFERPGLYLVQLSAGRLEATTVVLISDLGLIVKRAAEELFVFAQDRRKLVPRAGVRLIIADSEKILTEGKTDGEGVFRMKRSENQPTEALSILALSGDDIVWSRSGDPGPAEASEPTPRAFLFSDRPAYRPGDEVHLAGILRPVPGPVPSFAPGRSWTAAVDCGGQTVWEAPVTPDEFGVFATSLRLESDTPAGSCAFTVSDSLKTFSGSFLVTEFRRLPMQIQISLDHAVVFQGEEVKGVIEVRHAHGAPAQKQRVQYRLGPPAHWSRRIMDSEGQTRFADASAKNDTGWREALSDEAGRVRFSFPTLEYDEETRLELQVRLPAHNQVAEAAVVVSVAEFEAGMGIDESTIVAGVPFPVRVFMQGADGAPRSGTAVVEVFAFPAAGREQRIERHEVSVPDSGQATLMLSLSRPGPHALRLLAWDRARHPIMSERPLQVTGIENAGLRLELDRPSFAVGTTAQVTLHSEGKEALVLLTEETDRVLRHRAVRLRPGTNRVAWPIRAELAPNFLLAAAALDGERLWLAEREVLISQKLSLTLVTDQKTYRPGDEVTVTLSAADAAGRPADARIILSAVDETLLRSFPEELPDLLESFFTPRRLGRVLTSASNDIRFESVEAEESAEAEVLETEGSAAMAALRERRRAVTEKGAGLLGAVVGDSVGIGGLGTRGYGSGGGGSAYGRAAGVSSMRMGSAVVRGDIGGWLRQHFAETAAFLADLRTGPDGVVSATFRLPDSLTTWRILARAVTRDTQLGEIRLSRPAQLPFFADLILPPEVEEGDRVEPVLRVFNQTPQARKVRVQFEAAPQDESRDIEVKAFETADVRFAPREAPPAGQRWILAARIDSAALADRLQREIPVRPRGAEVGRTLIGVTEKAASASFDLPEEWKNPSLRLSLSLDPTRYFLGSGFDPLWFSDRPEEALLSIHLMKLLGPQAHRAMREPLRQRLRNVLNRLIRAQYPNGAFGLSRSYREEDLQTTCAAVRALAEAEPLLASIQMNISREPLDRAVKYLHSQLAALPPDDWHSRATVLWALSVVGEAQVPAVQLHRLHRLRDQMPASALVRLGLAWIELKRPEQALEVMQSLRPKLRFEPPARAQPFASLSWTSGRMILFEALRLLAATAPADPLTAAGTIWLERESRHTGFPSPAEAEAALRALLATRPGSLQGNRATVQLSLNGAPLHAVQLGPEHGSEEIQIPADRLRRGPNVLDLRVEGSGAVLYQATLNGWRRGPFDAPPDSAPLKVVRHVELLPGLYRGEELSMGFGALQPGSPAWNEDIAALPAGRRARVTIEVTSPKDTVLPQLAVEERLPPGVEFVEGSTGRGDFGMLRQGRRLAFFLPPRAAVRRIRYDVEAVFPGAFRFGPLRVISLPHPEDQVLIPEYELAVSPAEAPPPEVRATPDELLSRGQLAVKHEQSADAVAALEELLAIPTLREDLLGHVLGHLLFSSIALRDHPRILKYFELTKEKNPDFVIPFDKLAAIQESYRSQKVFEAGVHLARGAADALFLREVRHVGMLVNEEEVAEAVALFERLAGAYPASGQNALARYAFSQRLFSRADRLAEGVALPGFDRPGLLGNVVDQMSRYLAEYPDHPHAAEAFLSLASAHLERGDFSESIAWGRTGLARHPESDMAPAITHFLAFAHFRQGNFDDAMHLCQKIARGDGGAAQDDNAAMATYIMAQIYHARGDIPRARELYQKVADRFRDAAETLADFERERFELPELIEAPASREVVLPLRLQNIRRVDLSAYPVDLPRLVRVKGSLERFSDINLAGIRPVWSRTLDVPPSDGRVRSIEVRPSLGSRGAFLVLARAGARVTHALVLRDSLQLDVIQDAGEGRVRVTVRDSRGRPIPGARVQLKGADDSRFLAGSTDLRGIFLATEVNGSLTVVASHQGAFGLYRSAHSGVSDEEEPPPPRIPKPAAGKMRRGQKTPIDFEDDLIEGDLRKPSADAGKQFFEQAEQTQGMTAKQAM